MRRIPRLALLGGAIVLAAVASAHVSENPTGKNGATIRPGGSWEYPGVPLSAGDVVDYMWYAEGQKVSVEVAFNVHYSEIPGQHALAKYAVPPHNASSLAANFTAPADDTYYFFWENPHPFPVRVDLAFERHEQSDDRATPASAWLAFVSAVIAMLVASRAGYGRDRIRR